MMSRCCTRFSLVNDGDRLCSKLLVIPARTISNLVVEPSRTIHMEADCRRFSHIGINLCSKWNRQLIHQAALLAKANPVHALAKEILKLDASNLKEHLLENSRSSRKNQ